YSGGPLEIHRPRGFADRDVIAGLERVARRFSDPTDFDVRGLVGPDRHIVGGNVGEGPERFLQLPARRPLLVAGGLKLVLQARDFANQLLGRFPFRLGPPDGLRDLVTPLLELLEAGLRGAALFVQLQNSGRRGALATLLQGRVERLGIISDPSEIEHGNPVPRCRWRSRLYPAGPDASTSGAQAPSSSASRCARLRSIMRASKIEIS